MVIVVMVVMVLVWFRDGEEEMEVAETKILSFFLGLTRMDRIRKERRGREYIGRLDPEVGSTWQEAQRKSKEEIYGCILEEDMTLGRVFDWRLIRCRI